MILKTFKSLVRSSKRRKKPKKKGPLADLEFIEGSNNVEVLFRAKGGEFNVAGYNDRTLEMLPPIKQKDAETQTEGTNLGHTLERVDQGVQTSVSERQETGIQAEKQMIAEKGIQADAQAIHTATTLQKRSGNNQTASTLSDDSSDEDNGEDFDIQDPGAWDGFPSGKFRIDVTREQANNMGGPIIHWATKFGAGYRNHPESARHTARRPREGYKSVRRCLGAIGCRSSNCKRIIRPGTSAVSHQKRLDARCSKTCRGSRYHIDCNVKITRWEWAGGIRLEGSGQHTHPKLTEIHTNPEQKDKFANFVNSNQGVGAYALSIGVSKPGQPLQSAKDISPVYHNVDRLATDMRTERNKHKVVDERTFLTAFKEFQKKRPGFIKQYVMDGDTIVISLQSDFMLSQLLEDEVVGEPVNGTVNDAAMGICKAPNDLLMTTSTFSPAFASWTPALFSYMDGATTTHFKHHFRALMNTVAEGVEKRNEKVQDELFLGVMDLSDAESAGFVLAFKEFFNNRADDSRTDNELEEAARSLLRGCQEHFRASVTRICKLGPVISTGRAEELQERALSLLKTKDAEEFQEQAMDLAADFTMIQPWLSWWLRKDHAAMLFESKRRMLPALWDSIPSTTNAQEAMHFKLYQGIGKKLAVIELLEGLGRVADEMEAKFNAYEAGAPIGYGTPGFLRRKRMAEVIGRTKSGREPSKRPKRDDTQRPPDTLAELSLDKLKPRKKQLTEQQLSSKSKAPDILYQIYPWDRNSCYLDTSLELIFQAIQNQNVRSAFTIAFADAIFGSPLHELYSAMQTRWSLGASGEALTSEEMANLRDTLRATLHKKGIINALDSPEPLWVWLTYALSDREYPGLSKRGSVFFRMTTFNISCCSGCERTGGMHMELKMPQDQEFFRLTRTDNVRYKGRVSEWFKAKISVPEELQQTDRTCWRGEDHCPGVRLEMERVVLSIPIVLIIQFNDTLPRAKKSWKFPKTLLPASEQEAKEDGLIYNFVGLALYTASHGQRLGPTPQTEREQEVVSEDDLIDLEEEHKDLTGAAGHFTARILKKESVFIYDDTNYKGRAIKNTDATPQSHLYSKYPALPPRARVFSAVYVLQGGVQAQDEFFRLRSEELKSRHMISVTSNDLDDSPLVEYIGDHLQPMDPSQRDWLSDTKRKSGNTSEYISNPDGAQISLLDDKSAPFKSLKAKTKRKKNSRQRKHIEVEVESEDEKVDPGIAPKRIKMDEPSQAKPQITLASSKITRTQSTRTIADFPMSESRLPSPASGPPLTAAQHAEIDAFLEKIDIKESDLDDGPELNCRCGKTGPCDPASISTEGGEVVQCTTCKNFSHKACQVDGRADGPRVKFICVWCNRSLVPKVQTLDSHLSKTAKIKKRRSLRKDNEAKMMIGKPLNQRLRAGIGGLAKLVTYWYPVRIIQVDRDTETCVVKWWRGCIFPKAASYAPAPGSVSSVPLSNVVDCLWGDRNARRAIRLGRFTDSNSSEHDEDHLLDCFETTPYTKEIHAALEPAIPTLRLLLDLVVNGVEVPANHSPIPALEYAAAQERGAQMSHVPFPGDLTMLERAQTMNWFEKFVAPDKSTRGRWKTSAAFGHAITVLLSYRAMKKSMGVVLANFHLEPVEIERAWKYQKDATGHRGIGLDIDRECQALLERRMFEVSSMAGVAGHYQWGRDAGDHEECWNPYEGQEEYNDGSRPGSEGELLLGKDYVYVIPLPVSSPLKIVIKPRLRSTKNPQAEDTASK